MRCTWAAGRLGAELPIAAHPHAPPRIVASRSHGDGRLDPLVHHLGVEHLVPMGSSLKFCVIARGEAEVYPRFTPTSEWDTAAGQAVLEAAGGAVLTVDGSALRYGKGHPQHLNPGFVAAAARPLALVTAEAMRELLP